MKAEYIPNLLCVFRMLLVAPLVWLLVQGGYMLALGLFLIAGFTDALDGYLAKNFDWRTQLGAILDPAADKLMLVSVFLTLALLGHIPVWLFLLILGRDLVIVAGAITYRVLIGPFRAGASPASKANTAIQLLFVTAAIGRAATGFPDAAWLTVLGAIVFATTLVSGLDYVFTWSHRAWLARSANHGS